MTPNPADSAGMTPLVRYGLTIDTICAPDCTGWARGLLTGLGLAVNPGGRGAMRCWNLKPTLPST